MVKSSSHPRRTGAGTSRSITPANAPHFFKIITSSSAVRHSKLMIPRKFVSKYGKNLPDLVRVKVPSGAEWQVALVKSNGDVWLCNGWKEFTEYYSVKFGHFLVFRYDGNSHFHVLIFDTSASEIEYPYGCSQGGQSIMDKAGNSVKVLEDFPSRQTRKKISERDENENDDDDDDDDVSIETLEGSVEMVDAEEVASVEILDNPPTCRSIPASDVQSHKIMRANQTRKAKNASHLQPLLENFHPSGTETRELKLENLNGDAKPYRLRREIRKECSVGMPTSQRQLRSQVPIGRQLASTTADHKFRVLQRAKAFKSKNPFFTVCMKPSYVSHLNALNIPVDFARKYLSAENSYVKLRISDGKVWPVSCYYYRALNVVRKLRWGTFALDNNVQIGDVCVFEMIQSAELLFNVIIFRATEY